MYWLTVHCSLLKIDAGHKTHYHIVCDSSSSFFKGAWTIWRKKLHWKPLLIGLVSKSRKLYFGPKNCNNVVFPPDLFLSQSNKLTEKYASLYFRPTHSSKFAAYFCVLPIAFGTKHAINCADSYKLATKQRADGLNFHHSDCV